MRRTAIKSDVTLWRAAATGRRRRLLVVAWLVMATRVEVAAADVPDPVQAGREALSDSLSYPWYDSATDGPRRIAVRPPPQPSSYNWLRPLAWVVLGVTLALIAFVLIRALLNRQFRVAEAATPAMDDAARKARVEALPFPVRHDRDLLSEAADLYRQGRYAEAVIYLFSYQLVELDRRQCIRLARGKTNRQYLRELGRQSLLRRLLEQTMVAFEEVFFGSYPLSRERFEACWSRVDEFNHLAQESTA